MMKMKIEFHFIPHLSHKKKILIDQHFILLMDHFNFFMLMLHFLKFLAKSAVDPKYALVCVDLFTSKVYVYTMRKKSNLVNKLETFYKEIESKRNKNEKMRLQTDQEFQQ